MVERTMARSPTHRLSGYVDVGSPLSLLQRDVNSVITDFWRRSGFTVGDPTESFPRVNVSENAEAFRVSADLPGLDGKTVKVYLENDSTIVLEGERTDEHAEHGRNWVRREREAGAFRRAIELPVAVDPSKVTAAFAKGVLTVEAAKSREAVAKRRSIEVKS
jgi:HSP20 family protein